jgi:hypothetical protein
MTKTTQVEGVFEHPQQPQIVVLISKYTCFNDVVTATDGFYTSDHLRLVLG